jgi:hypothetical protein
MEVCLGSEFSRYLSLVRNIIRNGLDKNQEKFRMNLAGCPGLDSGTLEFDRPT